MFLWRNLCSVPGSFLGTFIKLLRFAALSSISLARFFYRLDRLTKVLRFTLLFFMALVSRQDADLDQSPRQ